MASLRTLLAYMWAYPGKQLLFMGGEIAQEREWNHDASLQWELLEDSGHAGVQRLVRDLNRLYRGMPVLWEQDAIPSAFRWTADQDSHNNVVSFVRAGSSEEDRLVCICNLAPVLHRGYRVGLPKLGPFQEVLNTDASDYGGGGRTNPGIIEATVHPAQGLPHSAPLTLPPLTAIWLRS
jgi:1,4-alpha-glucan branching enzyme